MLNAGLILSNLWHKKRADNIGGSEVAALFGHCPYKSYYQLWHEKKGNVDPPDFSNNERIDAGNFLEEGVLNWSNSRWKTDFYQPNIYVEHAEIKGMGCTPDAYSISNTDIMAQVKTVDSIQFAKEWEFEGEIITHAPLHILLQVHHELECCDKQTSWLIVLVGGNRLFYMQVERDLELCKIIKRMVVNFWNLINLNKEPDPNYKIDKDTIKKVRKTLKHRDFEDYSADNEYYLCVKKRQKLKVIKKKIEDRLEAEEARIYHLSLNTESIKCKNFEITFSEIPAIADKKITASDIGSVIKGRKASTRLNIKDMEILL